MESYSCMLAGLKLSVIDVDNTWKNTVVRHEYPKAAGADLELMGWNAPEHTLRIGFGANEENPFEQHVELLNRIRTSASLIDFEHPVHGKMKVAVESVSDKNDDSVEYAELTLGLVVSGFEPKIGIILQPAQVAENAVARKCQEHGLQIFGPDASKVSVPRDAQESEIMRSFAGMGVSAQKAASEMALRMGKFKAYSQAAIAPLGAISESVQFGQGLADEFGYQCCKFLESFIPVSEEPNIQQMRMLATGFTESYSTTSGVSSSLESEIHALVLAVLVANFLEQDAQRLASYKALENTRPWTEQGERTAQEALQIPASYPEIKNLVEQSLLLLSKSARLSDDFQVYQTIGNALRQMLYQRAFELEKTLLITVSPSKPLHAVLAENGLPYAAAERIMLINPEIRNPSFVEGSIRIYAN